MFEIRTKGIFHSIDEFDIVSHRVGAGSFGMVKLARHKRSLRLYAMKIIDLTSGLSEIQLKMIQRQVRLHSSLDHPHLIKLWDTIYDGHLLYMIMQFAEEGTLFSLQSSRTIFSQPQAFKFFSQTIQGLAYMHGQDILHRDLKPENILLDSAHNVKICDFGWSAEEINTKRNTLCGTYEYMAPQMIFGKQYNYKVDIWALGVLLYEMLHGNAPFQGKSIQEVQQSLLRGSAVVSSQLSPSLRSLLISLLSINPDDRPTIQEIQNSIWIQEMNHKVNNYLSKEVLLCPNKLKQKINEMGNKYRQQPNKKQIKYHRKNGSMLLDQTPKININLQINNYQVSKKIKKNRRHFYSQQRFHSQNQQLDDIKATNPLRFLNESVIPTQKKIVINKNKSIQEDDFKKIIQKIKNNSSNNKQKTYADCQSTIKRKLKLRKSQIQQQKSPARFKTQFQQRDQVIKLKKNNTKNKIGNLKAGAKIAKGKYE